MPKSLRPHPALRATFYRREKDSLPIFVRGEFASLKHIDWLSLLKPVHMLFTVFLANT